MPHSQAFDDGDPLLARLREVCLALPAVEEKVSHGRPTFACGRSSPARAAALERGPALLLPGLLRPGGVARRRVAELDGRAG